MQVLVDGIEKELQRLNANKTLDQPDGYSVTIQSFQHRTVRIADAESFRVVPGGILFQKLRDLKLESDDPSRSLLSVYWAVSSL